MGGWLLELNVTYSVGSRLTLRFWLSDHSDVLCTGIVRCLHDGQGDWRATVLSSWTSHTTTLSGSRGR